jgi:glycosyltransferase involved in cell wall biosynthesis
MTEELGIAAQFITGEPTQYVDIPTAYKRALPRFDKLFQLLTSMVAVPRTFLEYGADDVSLGIVAGKAFPEMAITVYAPVEEIADRLRQYAGQAKLTNVTVVSEVPKDQRFGVIFLPDTLELQPSPQAYLEEVQKTWLAEDGLFLFTSRCGRERARYDGRADQFWNFDYQDFTKLLDGVEFQIAFNDERASAQENPRGRWCGVFKRAAKYGNFDIQGKALRTRPYKRLSVCMITRNEEDWLRHALKSVLPIADELIVADSKSTDKTQEIAKEYGCNVTEIEFDNFAQARNVSLDRATGDWVLWMDADEYLLSPESMRKYLNSEIFEGYAIRQQHLMIDTPGSFDLPVRLFKHRPHYRFVGYIHEHCEDTSRGLYDNEIRPSLVIDEMDLAHYGYPNEAARRSKCSFRNMELLRRDVIDNGSKGRMLTWLLVIRDYLNIVKWSFARNQGKIQQDSQEHKLLNAAVSTYLHFFAGGRTKYAKLVEGMYQDCLLLLGRSGLCYGDCPHPPFQVDLAFGGAVGEQPSDRQIKSAQRWFISDEELLDYLRQKGIELVTKLGIADGEKYSANGTFPSVIPELPDAVELLGAGIYT